MFSTRNNKLLCLAYGQFGLSIMQVMFMFYYVKVFVNVFHVSRWWFNLAQALFMVWNAINDPLFGFIQDMPGSWLNSRAKVTSFFAPFIASSFIFLWFPWDTTGGTWEGIHLILALFLYDAFFSAIGVAWGAMFADITQEDRVRVAAMKYSQVAILLSVNIIAVTEKVTYSLENFHAFQNITIVVAVIAFICLKMMGSSEEIRYDKLEDESNSLLDEDEHFSHESTLQFSYRVGKEIVHQKNFLVAIATNFLQTARSVAHLNFASIATDILIPQSVMAKGSIKLAIFYGVLTVGPQLLLIVNESGVAKFGSRKVLIWSYIISICSGVFYISSGNPYATILFMVIDSVTVHSIAPLFNIILSEVVDEDSAKFKRKRGLSSLVFSLNAFFVKPAQSVMPVFIVYFLDQFDYQKYLTTKAANEDLKSAMATVVFMTPAVLGALQLLIFQNYSRVSDSKRVESV